MSEWLLVVLCAATGAYCLVRSVRMRRAGAPREGREAGGEAVMAFGMAAMGVPAAVLPPPPGMWALYSAVFGAAAVRAAWAARRGRGHLHHLVGSLAMVYMAVPLPGAGPATGHAGHAGHAGGGLPLVTGVLLAYYAVWVLRTGVMLVPAGPAVGVTVADGPAGGSAGLVVGGPAGAAAGGPAGPVTGRGTGAADPTAGGGAGGGPPGDGVWDGPELAVGCRMVMAVSMLAMLGTM
ncbi:hypothetical protein BJP40_25650 [Streptomyces sp. CC53]|uniref:DUF5134 domain-containing protein n=1 Tax=unclassified Streptomyces TaxID=2593676 RepID=UPI0008DE09D5|nr:MULTISPECIES: DUF5134 domain-containing protein [unclassified Streptomyces]OII63041.1 hypothetical protein BJP40_25650 [Streptomyces sp. CC53]